MVSPMTASRWSTRSSLQETALLALTVVFGLQVLRVLLTGLVFYIRDSQDAGSFVPGGYALVLFLLAFLAAPVRRLLGPRHTLILTAGGLALVRLVEQLVPWPVVDLGLTTLGTALFLLFIPTYVGRLQARGVEGGHRFASGLLLGIGIDTTLKGAFATLDLSWQPGVVTYVIVILLVGCQWTLLRGVVLEREPDSQGTSGFLRLAPLVSLGPILFLELLLFQNIGQQTALINWSQPLVFLWVVMANALGLMAVMGVMARPVQGSRLSVVALGGLFVVLLLGEQSGLAAAIITLFGQVAISMAVGMIAVAVGSGAARAGTGGAALASGLGMLLLLVLTFLYYVNYQFDVPGGTDVVPPLGAALVILCISGALAVVSDHRPSNPHWAPAIGSAVLLIIPLGYLAAWGEPDPVSQRGFPIRVMSYNLHQGFGVDGYLAIEDLADAIEEQQPDIIALQEVSRGWVIDGSFDMLPWLSRRLDMPYVWGPAADSVWGNAILSRFPISNSRTQPMPNNSQLQLKRSFTTAEIDVGAGESLTVIATHLHHVEDEGHLRKPQVRALLQAWEGRGRSVIMGDLNALPSDPEMLLLMEAGLEDAFLAAERPDRDREKGYTAPSRDRSKRIDYIWVSGDLKASEFSLTDTLASDHLGVAVTLSKAE